MSFYDFFSQADLSTSKLHDGDEEAKDNIESLRLVDEAALIEERRKRREAIKAKHRGQATPLLVQALAPTDTPTTHTPDRYDSLQNSGMY